MYICIYVYMYICILYRYISLYIYMYIYEWKKKMETTAQGVGFRDTASNNGESTGTESGKRDGHWAYQGT